MQSMTADDKIERGVQMTMMTMKSSNGFATTQATQLLALLENLLGKKDVLKLYENFMNDT